VDSVFKAMAVYTVLWLIMRLSGRRTLAKLTSFDLVLFLVIGGATQRALLGQDYSLINALVVISTMVAIDIGVGLLERDFPWFAKVVKGTPTILVDHGKFLPGRMRWSRVTESEVFEAARTTHGLERTDQIKFAILEGSGEISIIPYAQPESGPPQQRDLAHPARSQAG
jgi:uncharacterized membrane protein YcaP (DUF421 family)